MTEPNEYILRRVALVGRTYSQDLRVQQRSKRCLSSQSGPFSSHEARRMVYHQNYGARTKQVISWRDD